MSDLPPLPSSDDPFEVLGIDRGTTPQDVRRAYVRLIRVYRPDRSPDEFQRVREAYERAKFLAEMDASYGVESDSDDETDADGDAGDGDRFDREIADSWTALADGRVDAAQNAMHAAWQTGIARVRPAAHRLLMADALGAPTDERLDTLLESWRAGAPLTEWLVPLLTSAELRLLLTQEDFDWPHLRTRPERDAAEALMRLRCQWFLREDRLAEAEAAVLDQTFVDDSLDRPYLAHIAGEVKCALAWRRPAGAAAIDERFPEEQAPSHFGWDAHDHYEAAQVMGEAWKKASSKFPELAALRQYFELWPVLDETGMSEVTSELLEDFHAKPLEYRGAFDAMHDAQPALLERYINSIQHLVGTDEKKLDPRRRRSVKRVLEQAEEVVRRDSLYQNISAVVGLVVLASLGSFFVVGWWGIAVVSVALALGFWAMQVVQDRLYRRAIQGPLMRIAVEEGLSVPALVKWIEGNKKTVGELANFTPFLEDDPVLAAMHWTMRLEGLEEDEGEGDDE